MPYVKKMYVTEIDKEFEGDTIFPKIDKTIWKETERRKITQEDIKYDFVTYQKK